MSSLSGGPSIPSKSISGRTDPVVRAITARDVVESLAAGLRDFQAAPLIGLVPLSLESE